MANQIVYIASEDGYAEADEATAEEALSELASFSHGCYQSALADGRETWSGSSLAGKAMRYKGHYMTSRDNFLARASVESKVFHFDTIRILCGDQGVRRVRRVLSVERK